MNGIYSDNQTFPSGLGKTLVKGWEKINQKYNSK